MGLKIVWTHFSQNELEKIYHYYKEKAGKKIAKKIIQEIYTDTLKLQSHPEIGQIEEFLKDRKEEFRYLVSGHYKIIYWVNKAKGRIEIVDVFDSRQNPVKINRTL